MTRSFVRVVQVGLLVGLATSLVPAAEVPERAPAPAEAGAGAATTPESPRSFRDVPIVTVTGTLKKIMEIPANEERPAQQILLAADGAERQVEFGPQSFLARSGWQLKEGQSLTIAGWQITRANVPILVARDVTSGEKLVVLRSKNGAPQWSAMDWMPSAMLQGTIKEIIAPAADAKADALVRIVLAVEKDSVQIDLAPQEYLTRMGLTLKAEQSLTVSGWQTGRKSAPRLIARECKLGGRSIICRTAEGAPAWETPKTAPTPAPNGAK